MKREYYASWSGGADSTGMILAILEHGDPLTAIVYSEIMFDKKTSAEIPEHREFIYGTAIPWFEKKGLDVIVLRTEKTALDWMTSPIVRGPRTGKLHGFPLAGNRGWCSIKRDCKLPPLKKFHQQHPNAIYYEGICIDEPMRIKKDKLDRGCYPLVKYGYSKKDIRVLCKNEGLLSPIYEFARHSGCFFCPNARDPELRHLRDFHPDLWERLLEIEANPKNVCPGRFNRREGLCDIEARFSNEEKH